MEATQANIEGQLQTAMEIVAHNIVAHKPLEPLLKGFCIAIVAMQELVDKEPGVPQRRMTLDNIYQDFPGLRECAVAVARATAVKNAQAN